MTFNCENISKNRGNSLSKNKNLYCTCADELIDLVLTDVENDEDAFVAIIGKFNEIKNALLSVLHYSEVDFGCIDISSPSMNGYEDEYCLSLWNDDGKLQVGVEPLKLDGKYVDPCADIVYLIDGASSRITALCSESDLHFVKYEECDEAQDGRLTHHDGSNELTSASSYSIDGNPVTKEEFDKKCAEIDKGISEIEALLRARLAEMDNEVETLLVNLMGKRKF